MDEIACVERCLLVYRHRFVTVPSLPDRRMPANASHFRFCTGQPPIDGNAFARPERCLRPLNSSHVFPSRIAADPARRTATIHTWLIAWRSEGRLRVSHINKPWASTRGVGWRQQVGGTARWVTSSSGNSRWNVTTSSYSHAKQNTGLRKHQS